MLLEPLREGGVESVDRRSDPNQEKKSVFGSKTSVYQNVERSLDLARTKLRPVEDNPPIVRSLSGSQVTPAISNLEVDLRLPIVARRVEDSDVSRLSCEVPVIPGASGFGS